METAAVPVFTSPPTVNSSNYEHQLLLPSSPFYLFQPAATSSSASASQPLHPLYSDFFPYTLNYPTPLSSSDSRLLTDIIPDEDANIHLPLLPDDSSLRALDQDNILLGYHENSSSGARYNHLSVMNCPESELARDDLITTSGSPAQASSALDHPASDSKQSHISSIPSASTPFPPFPPFPTTSIDPSPESSNHSPNIVSHQSATSSSKLSKRSLEDGQSPAGENEAVIEKRQRNTIAARKARRKKDNRIASLEEELKSVTKERDEMKLLVARLEGENMALRKATWG
ncbi:hypothetical protein BGW36DRAFT_457323 [Talaromyces proteolyticus]|uniref:BZIP domain-containing protein n=1 Tax=Talaromyces proteolyticus TaxID=1131652 RepID=A0AAD4Q752_9EURO|nr:uncharacterized protein BGW36DRAFT_457323 [Talaromyces proteolyticus]KAH8705987.1 hypothetical protein BGW36DRAFT_457323 [Talaromyces proteolyticus]